MERYMIRPKNPQALQNNYPRLKGFDLKGFDSKARDNYLDVLTSISKEDDPVYREMGRWMEDAIHTSEVRKILDINQLGGFTGTIFAEMTEEQANRIQQEVSDVHVLRDGPMNLIDPIRRLFSTHKAKIDKNDLWHLEAIGLVEARKHGFSGSGEGVVVAILDTGIDPRHPEIRSNVVADAYDIQKAFGEINPNLRDLDNLANQIKVYSRDTDGHGTHVSGLICGKKVGVAPATKMLNEIMLPNGQGTKFYYAMAMQLAITLAKSRPGLRLVNVSAGINGNVPDLREDVLALIEAGILPVFATGNEGRNTARSPGRFVEPLSVGAVRKKGDVFMVAGFSSGATIIDNENGVTYNVPDLVAPGDDVYSCVRGGGYEAWDGTSMATPIVSGIAALVLEKHPSIGVQDLIGELLRNCEALPDFPENRQGGGLIKVV